MKKIIFGFLLSLTAAGFVSCDMNDPNDGRFGASDPTSGWVEFAQPYTQIMTDTVFVVGCNNRSTTVPLTLKAPINTEGVTVNYTITDIEGSSAGLETHAFIPANSREGSFVITNTETLTSPVQFLVTLTSTDKPNITGGFVDAPAQTFTVTIVPGSAISNLYGNYDVQESSEEGNFTYESEVLAGAGPNDLIITNLYGVDPDAQTKVTVNADGTLSFPPFAENFLTTYNGVGLSFEGLSGTSDPCTGVITMSFNLRFGAGGANSAGPYNVTLTRQ